MPGSASKDVGNRPGETFDPRLRRGLAEALLDEPRMQDVEESRLLEHQLFTSLTVIRSSAELLRENPNMTPQERQHFLDAILLEEQRFEQLFEDLLRSP